MINHNNYEEYFLLYADNELNADERLAVETFVNQHPEFAEEFMLMQQTILPADNIVFGDKESLYKTIGNDISITNYEEHFLLHIDNELSAQKKADTERFVLQHPKLQEEFTLLQQSRLPLETIEFPDKKSLYRKEEKERRIVPLYFRKLAIAAAVGTVALMMWWLMPANKPQTEVAVIAPPTEEHITTTPKQQTAVVPGVAPSANDTALATIKNDVAVKIKATKTTVLPNRTADKGGDDKAALTVVNIDKPANTTQQIAVPPVTNNSAATNNSTVALVQKAPQILKPLEEVSADDAANTKTVYGTENKVQNASYKVLDTDDGDDQTVYVASLQLNKNKVNGLFKKASRLLGNKAKQEANEDGKLQVAGFEVNTKNLK